MNRATLYIMCGLPFSGKSILAKRLADKFAWDLVEIDQIKTDFGLRDVWKEMKPEDWKKIFTESFKRVEDSLRAGKSVIHDSANQTKASRDQLRDLASKLGLESRVIFVDVSEETARKRWQENKETTERMDLPDWAFNAAVSNYKPPIEGENVLRYDPTDSIDIWISENFSDRE